LDLDSSRKTLYSRIYEGSVDEVVNWAIDLSVLMKKWVKDHPLYEYEMVVEDTKLYLTLFKNRSGNGKTDPRIRL